MRVKSALIASLVAALFHSASVAASLQFKVTDRTGSPVPDAVVEIMVARSVRGRLVGARPLASPVSTRPISPGNVGLVTSGYGLRRKGQAVPTSLN